MPSNFRDLMKRFWGVPTPAPAAPAPPPGPKTSQDYVRELDRVIQKNDEKLKVFIDNIDLRLIKRNMADISFSKPLLKQKIQKRKDGKIPFDPNKPVDFKNNPPKRKDNLPINAISENTSHLEWKKRANELRDIMNGAVRDLEDFFSNMARDTGYNPPKTDLGSLTFDLSKNKFPGIDRQSIIEIIKKIKSFKVSYGELKLWLQFFERMEKTKRRANRNKI